MAEPRLCSIPNCGKPAYCKTYCTSHYDRMRRHGSPTSGRVPNGEQWQYLLDHMWDDCPKWPYIRTPAGRGRMHDPRTGRMRFVHQIVCEMAHGKRPSPRHEVAHNCGLGHEGCFGAGCVEWKTREANQADRLIHGTHNRGTRHGQSKLSVSKVMEIRSATGGRGTLTRLAEQFGVTRETVRDIRNKRTWKWVD